MKVKVAYTVDASEFFRKALNHHYGKPGMASREDVRQWYETNGSSCNDDITYEYQTKIEVTP